MPNNKNVQERVPLPRRLTECHKILIKEYEEAKALSAVELDGRFNAGRREAALHALTQFELLLVPEENRVVVGPKL